MLPASFCSFVEDINQRLTLEAEGNTSNRATVLRLESQVQELSRQLQRTSEELEDTSKQLGKEQARNRSIDKHGQVSKSCYEVILIFKKFLKGELG